LFWGAILFDLLGVTHLAPWRKSLSILNRKIFIGISVFFMGVSIFLGVTMAYWRGVGLIQLVPEAHAASTEPTFQESGNLSFAGEEHVNLTGGIMGNIGEDEDFMPLDTSSNWIVLSTLMGISGLSLASTAFSMIGLGIMAKFLILLLICLAVLPLFPITFIFWLASSILNWVFNLVQSILDLMIQMGTNFLQLFGLNQNDANDNVGTGDSDDAPGEEPETYYQSENSTDHLSQDSGFNPFARR
jgi:hypothetical protein